MFRAQEVLSNRLLSEKLTVYARNHVKLFMYIT